jgi:hypothetical protein
LNEFDLGRPLAGGRLVSRMNSTSGGLRPTVGLRRPESIFCVGGGRRLAQGAPNEFGLQGPPADGRPAPTEESLFASAKADAWRESALEADFNRRRASGRRSACADRKASFASAEADAWRRVRRMNSASRGLRPTVGLRRPKNPSLRRRRPTPGAQRLERPISIGAEPPADGWPAPTEESLFASAKADARGASALEADFNRHQGRRPARWSGPRSGPRTRKERWKAGMPWCIMRRSA